MFSVNDEPLKGEFCPHLGLDHTACFGDSRAPELLGARDRGAQLFNLGKLVLALCSEFLQLSRKLLDNYAATLERLTMRNSVNR